MPLARDCLFIHIPKCSGTSIEVALGVTVDYPDIGLAPTVTNPHMATLFGGGLQHLTVREVCSGYADVAGSRAKFSFSVVRDPIDRFLSHFLWKHYRFTDAPLDWGHVKSALLADIEVLADLADVNEIFQRPFAGFEYCEGNSYTVGLNELGRHLLPQCAYLFNRGRVPLDAIYCMESIEALEHDLLRRGAISAPLPHRMVSANREALREQLPVDAERLLRRVYRHDLRLHAHVRDSLRVGRVCAGCDLEFLVPQDEKPQAARPRASLSEGSICPRKLWL